MWIVVAGWIAAVLVFSSFFMKTMIPLRIVAIASNAAFICYALLGLYVIQRGRIFFPEIDSMSRTGRSSARSVCSRRKRCAR
jgi:hypothetical protein